MSDIGLTQVNASVAVDAKASFDPKKSNAAFSYTWNFGDGATASGISVSHTYAKTGQYTLMLTARSPSGTRSISKNITVSDQAIVYKNPYASNTGDGQPSPNPDVQLPQSNDSLSDRVVGSLSPQSQGTGFASQPSQKAQSLQQTPFNFVVGIFLLLVAIVGSIGITLFITRKRV